MAGIVNDVLYALNSDFTGGNSAGAAEANGLVTDGKMWIGSTALNAGGTHINVGSLTSPDASVTIGYVSPNITLTVAASPAAITLTGSTGGALSPTVGNFNILPGANAGTSVAFNGSGSTLSLNFADANDNIFFGRVSGSGSPGPANVGVGTGTFQNVNTGQHNTAVGFVGLNALTSGQQNTCIGSQSLNLVQTGSSNVAMGYNAGTSYTSSESNNIVLKNDGVVAESNTIRIGNGTHTRFFGAGITGVTVAASSLTTCDSNGQLGALAPGTSGNVATSNGTTWLSSPPSLPSQLMVATLTLTSLQIKALHATPIQFIAAPGAGKMICLTGTLWGSTSYGGSNVFVAGVGQSIGLYYGTTTAASTLPVVGNSTITQSSDRISSQPVIAFLTSGTPSTTFDNIAVIAYNGVVTEITGNAANDNTVTITALYYIMSI